jgi:hypothetical protein
MSPGAGGLACRGRAWVRVASGCDGPPVVRALSRRRQPDRNDAGFSSFCAADRRPSKAKDHSYEDATKRGDRDSRRCAGADRWRDRSRQFRRDADRDAAASAGQAPASTWVTQQGDIAQVKRHIAWTAGDPAVAQRPRSDPPGGTDQRTVPRSSGMSCCTPGSSPGAGKRPRGAGRGAAGGDPPQAGPRPRAAASQVHGFSMTRCPVRLASRARVRPASTTIRRSW